MQKFEELNVFIDFRKVGVKRNDQVFYDLDIITVEGKQRYFTMTETEVNTVLSAFEILNKRKWGSLK